jgi:putative FmdB family regulatory protein
MPIFEYTCQDCGRDFEKLVRSGEQPSCPGCQSTHLEKRLSVFAAATAGAEPAVAPCGTCGHPGGPGSCALQ